MSPSKQTRPTRNEGPGVRGDDGCSILHVDMDAFYASVEVRRRPMLKGKAVIVGGAGLRGVVLSATYPARACGVRSAMPMWQARQLCPDAAIISPDMSLYGEVSNAVMEIFRSTTPLVEPISLDEAFLDISGSTRLFGTPTEIGQLIRDRVVSQQQITCSVGLAPTKFLAKLASAHCKPDGMLVVPPDNALRFLHSRPVSALWGVGKVVSERLIRLGIKSVADLARTPVPTLTGAVGKASAEHLHNLSWGQDNRCVVPDYAEKSVGSEMTFDHDLDEPETICRELLRLSMRVAQRLRTARQRARTVSLKVRFADFRTITRSRTLAESTDLARDIYLVVRDLYGESPACGASLRLVGVRADNLLSVNAVADQLRIGEPERGWREAEQAIDKAVLRFGHGVVRHAATL